MPQSDAERRPYQAPQFVSAFKLTQITAGAAVSGAKVVSDRRLKTEIRFLDATEDGIRLYAYRYVWSRDLQVGVMAQDLLAISKFRHAVRVIENGFYVVDYAALGLRLPVSLAEWEARSAETTKRHYRRPAFGTPVGLATITAFTVVSGAPNVT